MKSSGEQKINRAFRMSGSVIALMVVIGAGAYFINRIPKTRTVDPSPAPGPTDIKDARVSKAAQQPPVPFVDIATASGLGFTHKNGANGGKLLPETMVGGVAVFDADGDGRQDIAFACATPWTGEPFASPPVAGTSSVQLFLNTTPKDPGAAISFTQVLDCGLTSSLFAMGIAAGDYDGDSRVDLYVTGVGANQLFRNESSVNAPKFVDVTQ